MKVFISWSGEASRRVAEVLKRYLKYMIQELDPFMSQHDIGSGARWGKEIADALEESNFGIICLTPQNLNAPWILFEAGAITKHGGGRACCLLLQGLTPGAVTGPLAQFQHRAFSQAGVKALILDINAVTGNRLPLDAVEAIFNNWWDKLEGEVDEALKDSEVDVPAPAMRNEQDLLEELLLLVREIDRSMDLGAGGAPAVSKEDVEQLCNTLTETHFAMLKELACLRGADQFVDQRDLYHRYPPMEVINFFQFLCRYVPHHGQFRTRVKPSVVRALLEEYARRNAAQNPNA